MWTELDILKDEQSSICYLPIALPSDEEFNIVALSRLAFIDYVSRLDPVEAEVAMARIWPKTDCQTSLELLGQHFGWARERVRQKERKLMTDLRRLFFYGELLQFKNETSIIRLRTELSLPWREAVKRLDEKASTVIRHPEQIFIAFDTQPQELGTFQPFVERLLRRHTKN